MKRFCSKRFKGLTVDVRNPSSQDSVNEAINVFSKKVKDSKVLYEYKQAQYYTKKSQIKREARHKAQMRERKRAEGYDYPGKNLYLD